MRSLAETGDPSIHPATRRLFGQSLRPTLRSRTALFHWVKQFDQALDPSLDPTTSIKALRSALRSRHFDQDQTFVQKGDDLGRIDFVKTEIIPRNPINMFVFWCCFL
jgi:hypothetical protein